MSARLWEDDDVRVRWEQSPNKNRRSLVVFFRERQVPTFVFRDLVKARWRPAHKTDYVDSIWRGPLERYKVVGLTPFAPPPQPRSGVEKWIFIRPGTAPFGEWTGEETVKYVAEAEEVLDYYSITKIPILYKSMGQNNLPLNVY